MFASGSTRRRPHVVLALAASLLLGACVKNYDAYFANPCAETIGIVTYNQPPEEVRDAADGFASFTVDAGAVSLAEDAFSDAAGFIWSVRVDDNEELLQVDWREIGNDTVLIPASHCPSR